VFKSFIDTFDAPGKIDQKKLDALLDSLKTGPSASGGQTLLRSALTHYANAMQADDAQTMAQWMLLANAQTGLHEQIRLQPYIASSLDAPIEDVFSQLWQSDAKDTGPLMHVLSAVIDRMAHPLLSEAEDIWCDVATKELMTLRVPGQTLHLGSTLPAPPGGLPLYPSALDPVTLDDLAEVMELYGALTVDASNSGATDWARLPQRMTYIIDLFRSRQQVPSLYEQPFSQEQHQAILDHRVPDGPL